MVIRPRKRCKTFVLSRSLSSCIAAGAHAMLSFIFSTARRSNVSSRVLAKILLPPLFSGINYLLDMAAERRNSGVVNPFAVILVA